MNDYEKYITELFSSCQQHVDKIEQIETSGNMSFLIAADRQKYVLRLCGEGPRKRTETELKAEISLLNHLLQAGLPVPQPISFNGTNVVSILDRKGFCYKYLEGEAVANPDAEQCFLTGQTLGKIHKATAGFEFSTERRKWDLQNAKAKFDETRGILPSDFAAMFTEAIGSIQFDDNLPAGAIHEDFGRRHVLFRQKAVSGILDWDRCYYGYYILDIGQAIRGWCFDDWKTCDKEKIDALLRGYESQRKLSDAEKNHIRDAIKFALLERALSFAINEKDKEFALINLKLSYLI